MLPKGGWGRDFSALTGRNGKIAPLSAGVRFILILTVILSLIFTLIPTLNVVLGRVPIPILIFRLIMGPIRPGANQRSRDSSRFARFPTETKDIAMSLAQPFC